MASKLLLANSSCFERPIYKRKRRLGAADIEEYAAQLMTGPCPDDFVVVGFVRRRAIWGAMGVDPVQAQKTCDVRVQRPKEKHRLGGELLQGRVRIGMSQPKLVGLRTGIREPVGLGISEELQPVDERGQLVDINLQGILQARGIAVAEPRFQTLLCIILGRNEGELGDGRAPFGQAGFSFGFLGFDRV